MKAKLKINQQLYEVCADKTLDYYVCKEIKKGKDSNDVVYILEHIPKEGEPKGRVVVVLDENNENKEKIRFRYVGFIFEENVDKSYNFVSHGNTKRFFYIA